MQIRVICLGKIKEQNLVNLINKYQEKINHFINFEIIELNEITFRNESIEMTKKILEQEALLIEKFLDKSFNICLCIEAKTVNSETFSELINDQLSKNWRNINFIIGSSYGIDQSIKQKCHWQLSFSKMTFPHQLMRLILCEQIYRAFTIINHQKYHK